MKIIKNLFLVVLICGFSCNKKSSEVQIEHRIIDRADLLTKSQEDSIFAIIMDLDHKIGSQIGVLTIDTLNGESINEFSLKEAERRRLGRANYNDGILLTISFKDRKARIEVGTGLELIIKDEIAARIIRDQLVPEFRNDEYYRGISAAVKEIKRLIEQNKSLVGKRP